MSQDLPTPASDPGRRRSLLLATGTGIGGQVGRTTQGQQGQPPGVPGGSTAG